jgi:D-alanyl-D-alanine dipeptidase
MRLPIVAAAMTALLLAGCTSTSTDSESDTSPSQSPSTSPTTTDLPADFVRLSDVAPDIPIEIRYFGDHNFVGRPITGYAAPECILTRKAAKALARVQQDVSQNGYTLKVYDCFRPQRAVDDFADWAEDLDDTTMKAEFYPTVAKDTLFADGYIARQSGHSRGSTVDLTLVRTPPADQPTWTSGDPLVSCTAPVDQRYADNTIDMGTGFDCFSPVSATDTKKVGPEQRENRQALVAAMARHGFENYPEEWWHFTLADEPHPDEYFDFPVN